MKKKIIHIITSLDIGGAQSVLLNLASNNTTSHTNIVVNLKSNTLLSEKFLERKIRLYELNINSFYKLIIGIFKLIKILKSEKPSIVQTWLYHADLIGGFCAKISRVKTIIWNIRASEINYKLSTNMLIRINAMLSRIIPNNIIYCSQRSIDVHQKIGYTKMSVLIRNGINTELYKPSKKPRKENKKKFSLKIDFLIGMIARFDDQKDHKNLFEALKLLDDLNFKCLLIGDKISKSNKNLMNLINYFGLNEKIIIFEKTIHIYPIITCLDLHVLSSSYGEAFPNVVAETMSSGIPNIVTDIGDSGLIVGDKNWVVNPKNPDILAAKIKIIYNLFHYDKKKYNDLSNQVSLRIKRKFSISKMYREYTQTWNKYIPV